MKTVWSRGSSMALSSVLTLVMGVTAGMAIAPYTSAPVRAQSAPQGVVRGLPDFTELAEQVGPSVVNIRTSEKVRRPQVDSSTQEDEMQELLRRFFGPGFALPQQPRQPRNRPQPPVEESQPRGLGSGFILTADGYIMTNAHVVDGADEVMVTLTDKREFKARIIGADKRTDVAVVKIEASGLPAVKVGDVSRLKVGEWVMAIGSPFGLENSVTAGIVSAKQRDTGDYLPFIQTDVAINPGNSGGPLINMRGEVVGINSQIYSRSGGFMGISFSIPMDEAMRVSDQLRANGRVTRGRIGVQIAPVSKEIAESIGLGKAQGALVSGVQEGSPAEKAGIEPGDIITRFDGKELDSATDLPRMVGGTKPDSKVPLTVFRRGSSKNLTITVGEMEPDGADANKTAPSPSAPASADQLGLKVSELSESLKRELRLAYGVKIDAASDRAARAGLREGDILLTLANQEVTSVAVFRQIVARIDRSKPVSVLVRRGDQTQFRILRPEK